MRTLFLVASSCFLFAINCYAQQPPPAGAQVAASSLPSSPTAHVTADPGLSTVFDPVAVPPERPATNLPAAPSSALLNSNGSPTAATVARVPIAPEPRIDSAKRFAISNMAMYGTTIFHAYGRAAEVRACINEVPLKNGIFTSGPYQGQRPGTQAKFYAIALPIDAGVTMLSAFARRKGWRTFEVAGPLSAASAHITAGAFKFSSGCY